MRLQQKKIPVFGDLVFNFYYSFYFYCSSTVVSILTPPQPPASHLQTYPLWLCPCVLYTCSLMDLPFFPHFPSLPSPLVAVSLFFISMFLVVFCLLVCFVDQVPLIGEILWYLSFTAWLIREPRGLLPDTTFGYDLPASGCF